jgi:hypothetical protein
MAGLAVAVHGGGLSRIVTAVQVTPEMNAPISIWNLSVVAHEDVATALDRHELGSPDARCRHGGEPRGREAIVPDAGDQRRHHQQRVGVRLIGRGWHPPKVEPK